MLRFITLLAYFVTLGLYYPISAYAVVYGENTTRDILEAPEFQGRPQLEAIAVIFDGKKGFGDHKGNRGSGFIFNYDGRFYLFTNAHVVGSQQECETSQVVRNFNSFANIEAVKALGLGVEYSKRYAVPKENGEVPDWHYARIPPALDREDASIHSGHSYLHDCVSTVVINKKLDFAVFEISSPLNTTKTNNEIYSFPLESFPRSSIHERTAVISLNHTDGKKLQISDQCWVENHDRRRPFEIVNNCDIYNGASGSPLIETQSMMPIGLATAVPEGDLNYLNQLKLSEEYPGNPSVNLALVLPALIDLLKCRTLQFKASEADRGWMSFMSALVAFPKCQNFKGEIYGIDGSWMSLEGDLTLNIAYSLAISRDETVKKKIRNIIDIFRSEATKVSMIKQPMAFYLIDPNNPMSTIGYKDNYRVNVYEEESSIRREIRGRLSL